MSLKAFHVVFITVSSILAIGFGVWSIREYTLRHETASLLIGIGSLTGAFALALYGRWFLRKLRGVNSL